MTRIVTETLAALCFTALLAMIFLTCFVALPQ